MSLFWCGHLGSDGATRGVTPTTTTQTDGNGGSKLRSETTRNPIKATSLLPEQVAAHADDRVPGSVQTNVALERGPVPFALAAPAAAAAARALPVVAALAGGEASSAGPPAVTREAGIRGGHVCYWW